MSDSSCVSEGSFSERNGREAVCEEKHKNLDVCDSFEIASMFFRMLTHTTHCKEAYSLARYLNWNKGKGN